MTKKKKQQPKIDKSIIITGIICLTAIEMFALYNNINGALFALVAGIIGASIGIAIPKRKWLKE